MKAEVAAAVCYRRRGRAAEFLLVRTKGSKRWTFPKGHVKDKERASPWKAALREACEEAGVIGCLTKKRAITRYRYAKGGALDSRREDLVAAYLVEVQCLTQAHEGYRRPTWFSARRAARALATQNEPEYVREHLRVLRIAVTSLRRRSGTITSSTQPHSDRMQGP